MGARKSLQVAGTVRVPGDKSISHRALIMSALADGPSRITHVLRSADIQATASALRALGVDVPELSDDIVVHGKRPAELRTPLLPLDCANSGTSTRLLAGVVAGLDGRRATLIGDASLSRRPMGRIAAPLRAMGARIDFDGAGEHLPMTVHGAALTTIDWKSEHSSAQVKGAILLAGLVGGAPVVVREPHRSRDHTERMFAGRGVAIDVLNDGVRLYADQRLTPLDVEVPADPSSAAFFAALAALADDGSLRLVDVCLNPTRTGFFDILGRMGVTLRVEDERVIGGEKIGTVVVTPAALSCVTVRGEDVPRCIDELPLIACLAARATGETRITDALELRVKESDRITAVVHNLRSIGVDAHELPDGMVIQGAPATALRGKVITHGDHRLAMAFGILSVLPGAAITIDDPDCVAVSYPDFWLDLARVTHPEGGSTAESAPPEVATHFGHPDTPRFVIAIDGPAASGKSSTAHWVAQRLGVRHVDSGAFYRAITALGLESTIDPEQWTASTLLANTHRISWRLTTEHVLPMIDGKPADESLRGREVTRHVSRVAQMFPVREWVNSQVREAATASDVVVDGRDIGTAVFPGAALKVFLIADPWERARRRLIQRLRRQPVDTEIAEETELLVSRDALDATQSAPARDAITIDTTALTQEEQVERIVTLARVTRERLGR